MRTPIVGVVCLALVACVGVERDPAPPVEPDPLPNERRAMPDRSELLEDALRHFEEKGYSFDRDFCLVSGQCDPEPRYCLSSLDLCDEDHRLEPLPLDPPGHRPE